MLYLLSNLRNKASIQAQYIRENHTHPLLSQIHTSTHTLLNTLDHNKHKFWVIKIIITPKTKNRLNRKITQLRQGLHSSRQHIPVKRAINKHMNLISLDWKHKHIHTALAKEGATKSLHIGFGLKLAMTSTKHSRITEGLSHFTYIINMKEHGSTYK